MAGWWERYYLREMRLGCVQAGSKVLFGRCKERNLAVLCWYQSQGTPDIAG